MSRFRIVTAMAGAIALLASLSGTASAANHTAVRLWNAINTQQTLDLLIDGNVVFHDVAYGTVTDRVVVDPGSHQIEVRDSTTHQSSSAGPAKFPYQSATTIEVFHPAGGVGFAQDELTTLDDAALVRFWAITAKTINITPIDVVESGDTLGEIPNYTNPSDYIKLTPGTHHLSLVNPDTGFGFFHFTVDVEAATNYTAFFWDDDGTTLANLVVDAENVSDSAVGVGRSDGSTSLLGLGILVIGFASWLAVSTARRRRRLG